MLLLQDLNPTDAINILTIKDVGIVGLLLFALIAVYRYFSQQFTDLKEENRKLREEYDRKLESMRTNYDTELREMRNQSTALIEKLSALIQDNTRVLQEVNIELTIRDRNAKNNSSG